jgi:hypothetical protein
MLPAIGILGCVAVLVRLVAISYDLYTHEIRPLPIKCPHCALEDNSCIMRKAIPETGWEELTCSSCHQVWYQLL